MNGGGDARSLVGRLGGTWRDRGGLARCPVLSHGLRRGDINPSLSITCGDRQPVLIHCFAGCDHGAVVAALQQKLGAGPLQQSGFAAPAAGAWEAAWRQGRKLESTPATTYLADVRRVLDPLQLETASQALRFHPQAPFSATKEWRTPGLLAAVTVNSGQLLGMQVTALRPDGRGKAAWRKTRHTFGRIRGGAVRLGDPLPGRRDLALAVAEGVETALGFSRLSGYSSWAALGGSLASFEPPADLAELVIAADHDQPGLTLAAKLAYRLRVERPSLLVEIRHPAAEGRDWADEAFAAFGDG